MGFKKKRFECDVDRGGWKRQMLEPYENPMKNNDFYDLCSRFFDHKSVRNRFRRVIASDIRIECYQEPILARFWHRFGSILGRFWLDFGMVLRLQILTGKKSERRKSGEGRRGVDAGLARRWRA